MPDESRRAIERNMKTVIKKTVWAAYRAIARIDRGNWNNPESVRRYFAERIALRLLRGSKGSTLRCFDSGLKVTVK